MIKKERLENVKLGYVFAILLFFLLVLWSLFASLKNYLGERYSIYNDHFEVKVNDGVFSDVSLSDFVLVDQPRKTIVEITNTIPSYMNRDYTLLPCYYLCSVEAFVDGKLIYSAGVKEVENNEMFGCGYHFMNLPEGCGGKTLKIRLVANEPKTVFNIGSIKACPSSKVYLYFFQENFYAIFTSILLIFVGLLSTICSIVMMIRDRSFYRLLLIGIFSLGTGIWTFFYYQVNQLFSDDITFGTTVEYVSLYLTVISFGLLILFSRRYEKSWRLNLLKINVAVLAVFVLVCFILHFVNILRIPYTLPVFHVLTLFYIVTICLAGYFKIKLKSYSRRYMVILGIIMSVSLVLEIIRHNVLKYVYPNSVFLSTSFIPISSLVSVVIFFMSFMAHMYEMALSRREKEVLTDMAFNDPLTGFYNRAKYVRDVEEFVNSKKYFAMVNCDVNGLKYVNDKFGHRAGDELLKSFSECLRESVPANARCYRMGGDEFMVLVADSTKMEVNLAMENLVKHEREISEGKEYVVEASYGVAFSNEVPDCNPQKLYTLADKKMYEMKTKCHSSRRGKTEV